MGGLNDTMLQWEEIVAAFRRPCCGYPVAAARAVLDNPEFYEKAVVEFERMSCQADELANDMFHLHAMHLLAEKREARAFAPLMRIAALPDEDLELALGDHLTETFKNCVAATCHGEEHEAQIRAFIENRTHAEWARLVLVEALVLRVIAGDTPAEPLLDWLQTLGEITRLWLQECPVTEDCSADELLMDGLAGAIADLGSPAHLPLLQSWWDADVLDPQVAGIDWYAKELNTPLAERRENFFDYKQPYITDAIDDMSSWYCFSEKFHRPIKARAAQPIAVALPYVREESKVGRNDPCPCGSGKKHKKCCGA